MASSGNNDGSDSHDASRGPPIPLQDLSIASDDNADGHGRSWWRDSGSHRGRWSESRTPHHVQRGSIAGRYERVADDSPSRSETRTDPFHTVDLGEQRNARARRRDDVDVDSPGAGLAHATVGLSFNPPPLSRQSTTSHLSDTSRTGASAISAGSEDVAAYSHSGRQDSSEDNNNNNNSLPAEAPANDRTPLTDRRYLQPISGTAAPQGQRHDRHSPSRSQSVGFDQGPEVTRSRLGDDLPHLEEGLGGSSSHDSNNDHPRSRPRTGSASNHALSKAGSMMRMVSQRVVNLSNEPELVEQSIRRKSSVRQARMEGPPALPAMPEYAHDANSKAEDEDDVGRGSSSRKQGHQTHEDILRGNSLGIFSPENKLRKALCEILVHPITEPAIFFLIIVQTVLLAVESSDLDVTSKKGFHWGAPVFDYAFLGIFIIYTLELAARIIVSGLILNPTEFSTLDRSEGLKNALMAKARELVMPHEQPSSRRGAANPQVSILRSLTGFQQDPDPSGSSSQQQRARLARRAFLRHSFNRLDFLAVLSYWISFLLSIVDFESKHHFHVFRMLSCLRILRLLALTNGTSV